MAPTPQQRLARYREMRDFTTTSEPAGGAVADTSEGRRFVVQLHRATRRHYDFRLEHDGVLLSWAVPKGPTLDPKARHLAVEVEDHPLEYADFEGVIPTGEYGGGDVIVWDRGHWEPAGDVDAALKAGDLHFDLFGEKLHGRFVLVRRGKRAKDDDKPQWILLHKDDDYAVAGWDLDDHPKSVRSGRTNQEVAAAPSALWRGGVPAAHAEVTLAGGSWSGPTDDELGALAALGKNGKWSIGGVEVALTNLDKELFGKSKRGPAITKREVVAYYAAIAPVMLPYLAGRPINVNRYPNGIDADSFWQKAAPDSAPEWVRTWDYPAAKRGDTKTYVVVDSVATLVWLANRAAIELHAWTSTILDFEKPTWVLFDIDPGEKTSFDDVLTLARLHRTALRHLDVIACPKVTGKRGIQIWVPIEPVYGYQQTRDWAQSVSEAVAATTPELVSFQWHRDKRGGKARLDYTQNVINKTLVAPYSVRPAIGAPVSVPITWDELDDPNLAPDGWTIRDLPKRLTTVGDPFAELLGVTQPLPELS